MMFDIHSYAISMATYNQWMNDKIYAICAGLSDDQRKANCGLFFGSIDNTLNHLLVCDLMWMARFNEKQAPVSSLTQRLYENFAQMTEARFRIDRDILVWAKKLSASALPERLYYCSLANKETRDVDLAKAIVHFFNHQTHHRGQISAGLSQLGVEFGVTDLIFMPEQV
ncbi:DinB family protein [Zhongshania sp. BJYM1]|uniref:DinB family protein n=1 Tax=Zhongshania aquatica TaxID=2965069 RepID=UPI0022B46171|nr:DinB family protein [Marortus sp. BJYM1]